MKKILAISLFGCILMLSGCGCTMSDRAISGAMIGAGIGAAGGAIGGAPVPGALIGAGVGAAVGAFVDDEYINLGDPLWRY